MKQQTSLPLILPEFVPPVEPPVLPTLRDYQQACVRHVTGTITRGHRRVWFSLPTGTGKSVILGALAAEFLPHGRDLVVAHLRQLIGQLAGHMQIWCESDRVGVVMGDQDEPDADVVVASIQTLSRGRLARILADPRPIAALFVDEFHHSTAASYRNIIEQVRAHSPDCVIIGCSATPFRSDKQTADLAELFPVCAFERSIDEMQTAGWLAPIAYQRVVVPMHLAEVVFGPSMTGEGDYQVKALAVEALRPEVMTALVGGTTPSLEQRCTLVFCAGVEHAHRLAEAYRAAGVSAAAVDGSMPQHEQDRILDAWRRGEVQVLCQDSLLGEGFDHPPIAALVLAAPTASLVRYIQRLGRGTRLCPESGKTDCLVLEATAGRPDPRQVTLGDVVPLAVGDLPRSSGGDKRDRKLVLLDPRHDVTWRWFQLSPGVYVVPVDQQRTVWLVRDPDPAGSGLYRGVLHNRSGQLSALPGFDHERPLRQMQVQVGDWLRDHAMLTLAGRGQYWHNRPASEAQFAAIYQHNRDQWRPDLTRDQAREIITLSMLRPWTSIIVRSLWSVRGD